MMRWCMLLERTKYVFYLNVESERQYIVLTYVGLHHVIQLKEQLLRLILSVISNQEFKMFMIIVLLIHVSSTFGLEASDIAKRVATRTKNAIDEGTLSCYNNFGTWNYEGAMIYRGLWEIQSALKEDPDFDIEPFLNKNLDFYQVDPDQFGYQILHNVSLSGNGSSILWPWLLSIGDNIGLFPIVYGDRIRYGTNANISDDLYIMSETVEKYILGYPWHLEDGTISRPYSWNNEGLVELQGQV